jgi:dihydrofolate reductase
MTLAVIVAVSDNGVIGRDDDLPWRLSADLVRFKRLTMGHHLIIGRRTFESIGRALPGRHMIVVTRNPSWPAPPGVEVATSLDQALALAAADPEVFVGGGAAIYQLALPRADRLYLTRVHATVAGDTFFPALDLADWRLVETEDHGADDRNQHPFTFERWERR